MTIPLQSQYTEIRLHLDVGWFEVIFYDDVGISNRFPYQQYESAEDYAKRLRPSYRIIITAK